VDSQSNDRVRRRRMAAAACDHMAEKLVESALGRHVLDVVGRQGNVSVSALLRSLVDEVKAAPSSCGKGSPELDIVRLTAEKAIDALTMELTARSAVAKDNRQKKRST